MTEQSFKRELRKCSHIGWWEKSDNDWKPQIYIKFQHFNLKSFNSVGTGSWLDVSQMYRNALLLKNYFHISRNNG